MSWAQTETVGLASVMGRARGFRIAAAGWSCFVGFRKFRFAVHFFVTWNSLGPVKTKAAFSATIGANVQEKQDPVFQNPPALGPMHVHASTARTRFFGLVDEESEDASHPNKIIIPAHVRMQSSSVSIDSVKYQ
jgi:hypothetical protein